MNKKFICVVLVSMLCVAGCASTPMDYKSGTKIKSSQLAQFSPGSTIQLDVVSAIGHPSRKEPLNGKELWYYDFTKIGAVGGNHSEATVFEWDANGKLVQTYKTNRVGKTGNALIDAANSN